MHLLRPTPDLVAIRDGESAPGAEVVLDVDDDEAVRLRDVKPDVDVWHERARRRDSLLDTELRDDADLRIRGAAVRRRGEVAATPRLVGGARLAVGVQVDICCQNFERYVLSTG